MDFWYFLQKTAARVSARALVACAAAAYLISFKARVPGRYRYGFFTPPTQGALADLRAALVTRAFRGALPPVDLRAVCLVLRQLTLVPRALAAVGWNHLAIRAQFAAVCLLCTFWLQCDSD
jgi:hypothetical protein